MSSKYLSLDRLSQILGTPWNLPEQMKSSLVLGINTDTRTLQGGEAFLALQGEKFDGHDFLDLALQKEAVAFITNKNVPVKLPRNTPHFPVSDTRMAYQKIANWWRKQFSIPIIGITGSVGKTTTKELIAAVLSTQGKVLKTQKNFNNEIGVPKTLLELTEEHKYGVIEMAMRGKGQIAELTDIAQPTIGVITNVGTAHIELLGTEEAIARAKCELLATMPKDSIAILNADNDRLIRTAASVWRGKTLTYGLEKGDIQGTLLNPTTLQVEGENFTLPLRGRHNASNFLAALAVARALNIDWASLSKGISVNLPGGRAQEYKLTNKAIILDESYNASFESMVAALELLKETPAKRHIAVLGTMKELGHKSAELHRKVGEKVKELQLDQLMVLIDDPQAEMIQVGAEGIPTECFTTHNELLNALKNMIQPEDLLLFKASNSVGLGKVVEELKQSV